MIFAKNGNSFPREIGPPRKVVNNKPEYLKYINLYNGKKKAIYSSIYKFNNIQHTPYDRPIYESAVVDKIYFDFDDKSCNAYENCNKLHKECVNQNLKHCLIFSGRGYHLYIYTKIIEHRYKKEAIRGGQHYFINKLKLVVDRQVIGNVAQLARIPNTFHIKAGRFCIPLTRKDFEKGDEYIKKLANKQQFNSHIFIGKKLLDISKWDIESSNDFSVNIPQIHIENLKSLSEIKDIPLCIGRLLDKKNASWKERYLIILYFKEKGYLKEEVFQILKKYLSEKKLKHCIKEERQLQYLFRRDDLIFPTCENLMNDGYCIKKCEQYGNVVYK